MVNAPHDDEGLGVVGFLSVIVIKFKSDKPGRVINCARSRARVADE